MKKSNWLKITLLVIAAVLVVSVAIFLIKYFTGYEVYREVRYSDGVECVMDIYIPNRAYGRDKNGAVLFIHGGSWSGGDKSEETGRCRLLASHGYITATVNYTLWSEENKDEYNVDLVLDEIDSALSTLQQFAAELGVTVDKAATAGYSAGAHLAMLYAYSRADTAPLDIKFVASMAGPADMSKEVWGDELSLTITKLLTGENVTRDMLYSGEADALIDSISPCAFIDGNSVPTLIIQGGRDNVVPPQNAESVVNRLSTHSVRHDYVYMNRSSHALIENPIGRLRYYKMLIDYCKEYFA